MKLTGNLKTEVENAGSKEEAKGIIEKAGMELTNDELDMVTGGAGFLHPAPKEMQDINERIFSDHRPRDPHNINGHFLPGDRIG